MFKAAWLKALSKADTLAAFAAAGRHPLKPSIVLNQLDMKTPTPSSTDNEARKKSPSSVGSLRRQIKAIQTIQGNATDEIKLLARAAERLVINNDIWEHENRGLREALQTEQKRRKRGKKIALFAKDEPGQATFFTPAKIAAVRAYQDELEAQKEQERLDKGVWRQVKAAEKERKAQEARERREMRQREAAEKRALPKQEKEARQLQKKADKQLKLEQEASQSALKLSTQNHKRTAVNTHEVQLKQVKTGTSRSGRSIAPSKHFQD